MFKRSRMCQLYANSAVRIIKKKVSMIKKNMQANEFKVALIGPSKTGKSTFVQDVTHLPQSFPTLGVNVIPHQIHSMCRVNLWDCAGDPRYIGLGSKYLTDSDLVLVFEDKTYVEWVPSHVPYRVVQYRNDADALVQVIVDALIVRSKL